MDWFLFDIGLRHERVNLGLNFSWNHGIVEEVIEDICQFF